MTKTLTTVRKEVDLHTCAQITNMANLFAKICEQHPEIVYKVLGSFLRRRSLDDNKHLINLYRDEAIMVKELFKI